MSGNILDSIAKSIFGRKDGHNFFLHIGLFILTFITTLIAGVQWTSGKPAPYELHDFYNGLPYALSIIFILGVHEFGHYFASLFHKVKVTLPYFIPFPPIAGFLNFGTMGAVIKTKSPIPDNKVMFDIGAAGPLSGFVACVIVLIYGFTHLPGQEYILQIHPDYFSPEYGKNAVGLEFGNSLLFIFLKNIFTDSSKFIPPMSEIYHYPYLCTGWFGLFVTSMNLIPVGQLDGGHIIYSMFNEKKQEAVAGISMILLIIIGVLGIINPIFNLGINFGWSGWLFWALILYFVIKVKHPPVYYFEELGTGRKILGYLAILIFILSFSPTPLIFSFQ
jgi:membrane-associated protease RseP (regulator of RpoE activity)